MKIGEVFSTEEIEYIETISKSTRSPKWILVIMAIFVLVLAATYIIPAIQVGKRISEMQDISKCDEYPDKCNYLEGKHYGSLEETIRAERDTGISIVFTFLVTTLPIMIMYYKNTKMLAKCWEVISAQENSK